ncbi:hypothetical protein Hanom_Chr17g01566171 [Helianthus anomalus]
MLEPGKMMFSVTSSGLIPGGMKRRVWVNLVVSEMEILGVLVAEMLGGMEWDVEFLNGSEKWRGGGGGGRSEEKRWVKRRSLAAGSNIVD